MDVATRTLIAQIAGTIVGALASIFGAYWNEKRRAKIADQHWRQDQKVKIYSQILGAIHDYTVWLGDVSDSRKFGRSRTESLELLERAMPAFSYHSSPFDDPNVEAADKYWELLKDVRRELTSSAARDLG